MSDIPKTTLLWARWVLKHARVGESGPLFRKARWTPKAYGQAAHDAARTLHEWSLTEAGKTFRRAQRLGIQTQQDKPARALTIVTVWQKSRHCHERHKGLSGTDAIRAFLRYGWIRPKTKVGKRSVWRPVDRNDRVHRTLTAYLKTQK